MAVEELERIVGAHALFAGLGEGFLELVSGCAKNVRFRPDVYLFREGEPANEIFLSATAMLRPRSAPRGMGG